MFVGSRRWASGRPILSSLPSPPRRRERPPNSRASDAVAALRELVSGPDVPPAVRLRASLAILQAADAMRAETIGSTSAEGVQAERRHKRWIDLLGG